ncbi:hypothetical protein RQP46_010184 [Phenoliferia psychrophenolica]
MTDVAHIATQLAALSYLPSPSSAARPVTFVPDTSVRQQSHSVSAPSTPVSQPLRYAPSMSSDGGEGRFGIMPATPPASATNEQFPPFVNASPPFVNTSPLSQSTTAVSGSNSNLWTQNSFTEGYWNPSYQGRFLAPADPRNGTSSTSSIAPHQTPGQQQSQHPTTLGSPFVGTLPRKRPAPLILDQGPLPKRPRPLSPSLLAPPPSTPPQMNRNMKRMPVASPQRRASAPGIQYLPPSPSNLPPRDSSGSPPINIPVVGFYVTPPESVTGEVVGEPLDLLPDTNWFVHRMRRPAQDGGNDNKLACALADSCVDLLGRAVRALSHDEWCLLNADDPATVEAAALGSALEHLRSVRQQEGKESADKLYRSLQLLLFVQFRDVMSQQIVNDSAERGHRLTTSELMCLPDTRARDGSDDQQFA